MARFTGESRADRDPRLPRWREETTIERIVQYPRQSWMATGEFELPGHHSGDRPPRGELASPGNWHATSESAQTYPRPPSLRLRRISLASAALAFGLAIALFLPGTYDLMAWLFSGRVADGWRAVALHITSEPEGADVYVDDRGVGRTPVELRQHCMGKSVRIRIVHRGFAIWQWHGICPGSGPLVLRADLQRRRSEVQR